MPWVTPDDISTGLQKYEIWLPGGVEYEACAAGAFLSLTEVENWESKGGQAPSYVAGLFTESLFKSTWWRVAMPVGSIIWGGWSSPPDGWLLCDGDTYPTSDYGELFAQIGYNFGGSAGVFRVPNLVDRVPVGSGNDYALGNTGGEKEHTLSTSEMPSHNHSIHDHLELLAVVPGEAPVSIPSILPDTTGQTGGGQPHNNMPPYVGLTAVIRYE